MPLILDQSVNRAAQLRKPPVAIPSLAKVPLSRLANLPAEPGVYMAVDDANRVWYVGTSGSIRQRLVGHDRLPDFRKNGVTAVSWRCEDSLVHRTQLEEELIEYFRPPLNAEHKFRTLPTVDLGLTPDEEKERFLRLSIQQKQISFELEMLKPNIVTLCEQEATTLRHPLGIIYIQSRPSWQYSEEVDQMRRLLKTREESAREEETALIKSVTVSPAIRLHALVFTDEEAYY